MKLSIITVNLNNAAGLKATLESVAAQTCQEFENIIIDGCSTDGSVPIIKSYEETTVAKRFNNKTQYPLISWVSESDKGIYDGMNKGILRATGEYVYFLNSGDALSSPTVLQEMIDSIDGSDFIIGRVNLVHKGGIVGTTPLLSETDMSLYNMYLHGINHQSALTKRDLLVQTPYDTSVKMGADWKFFVQAIVFLGATTKFVDMCFANYDVVGISSNSTAVRKERENILATFIPERIARDYLAIAPHYYEVIRMQWLLNHPFWYKLYRGITTFGRWIGDV